MLDVASLEKGLPDFCINVDPYKGGKVVEQAVILVGGKGSRLGALTEKKPKPLLDVAGRPLLEYLIWNLGRVGVREVILSTGYLADQFEALGTIGESHGLSICCIAETSPLGTGGALANMANKLRNQFIVLNGDSVFDVEFDAMDAVFSAHPSAAGLLALRHVIDVSRYGSVELDNVYIRRFVEKSSGTTPKWVNGGVYLLDRSALEDLPIGPSSIEFDLFPKLAEESRLLGLKQNGFFIDIGTEEDYARAQDAVPNWYSSKLHNE